MDRWSKPASTVRTILAMEWIERVYTAFNARDIDGALALMHEDVDWPNGWQGGRIQGREAVRDYWTRQFREIDSHVEPVDRTVSGDRVAVTVHQVVKDLEGNVLSEGRTSHVYTLRDGLVARMDIVNLS